MMTKQTSTLEFACCSCPEEVRVTVRCSGGREGADGACRLARVNVACPTCGEVNQLLFEPGGSVRSVRPFSPFGAYHEPSLN